jgi:hypothetical protein
LQGRADSPVDDRHIPLGQALKPPLLFAYAKTPTGRLVLAPTAPSDLFEDVLGLLTLLYQAWKCGVYPCMRTYQLLEQVKTD